MRTIADIGTDRLINVLVKDKNQSPSRIINILKSEITNVLSSYLELDDEIQVLLESKKGRLFFQVNATANRVKEFGQIVN
ncbi:MAG: cell division topological specificity factor MinE [Firmicutes bacterium]|nr:cell division topological specificity factor MinE [Bacillota bacterium]MDY3659300.1 cell division topological specificity factor MinE [Eubacteriales bacterium]